MPFAMIAVVLLILGCTYGAVYASVERAAENTDDVSTELTAIGDAMDDMGGFVNRGMGEILYGISSSSGGTLAERADTFEKRADRWFDAQFPMTDGCVTATLVSYNVDLDVKSLKLYDEDEPASAASVPAYLVANGEFTAVFSSESGTSERTIDIASDGSFALPLLAERASLFEQSLTGGISVLYQMMNYQLSAVAQARVLNGYGSLNEYGRLGTSEILTEEDIGAAYKNAVAAIEMICFRTSSDNILSYSEGVDLADLYVSDNGRFTIDLGSVYAQAMLSILDDLVLQWMEYLGVVGALGALDRATDYVRGFANWIAGAITGNNYESASGYLKNAMGSLGYSESSYRYLLGGKSASLRFTADSTVDGETVEMTIDSQVPYPDVDLLEWGGLSGFCAEYRDNRCAIVETVRSFIKSTALGVAGNLSMGSVSITMDSIDSETFLETMIRIVEDLIEDDSSADRSILSVAAAQKVNDPFYAAIYGKIKECKDDAFGITAFESSVRAAILEEIGGDMSRTEALMGSKQVLKVLKDYDSAVESKMKVLESLTRMEDDNDNVLKDLMIAIMESSLRDEGLKEILGERMLSVTKEMSENINLYACGITQLPGTDVFILESVDGRITERMSADIDIDIESTVTSPLERGGNMHYVGFEHTSGASYSSMFTVEMSGKIGYSASSGNSESTLLGVEGCSVSGNKDISMTVEIAVVSGWALAGVEYTPSNTLWGDAWDLLLEALEPIIEPLRKVYAMMVDIATTIASVLVEMAMYAAQLIADIYNAIMEPLEQLKRFIENAAMTVIGLAVEHCIVPLIDITSGEQGIGMEFFGLTFMVSTKAATWTSNNKTILKISLEGCVCGIDIDCSLTVYKNSSGQYSMVGNAGLSGGDWDISIDFDPTMRNTKHIVSLDGCVGTTYFSISFPYLVQYKELSLTLSDLPGIGTAMQNIPLPFPGLKGNIDAGLELKYSLPFERGLVINEFESNPDGTDTGREWVELYNNSDTRVDLTGYTIHAGSGPDTKYMVIAGETLAPRGRLTIDLDPKMVLINAGNGGKKGDCLILRDSTGMQIDKTPKKVDDANSEYTWQRIGDAATEWSFMSGTKGTANGGGIIGGEMMKAVVLDIIKDSASDAFEEMGSEIKSFEDLGMFFETMARNAIDRAIETIAGCLVEACVFVSLDVSDYSGSIGGGIKVSLYADGGLVEDALKWLVGQLEAMIFNVQNPFGMCALEVLTDNISVRANVHVSISAPSFLDRDESTKVDIGVSVSCNLSGLCNLFGNSIGKWKVVAGVVIENCPYALIPSGLEADRSMSSDLWLMRAVFGAS
jgi:hypothetical protein